MSIRKTITGSVIGVATMLGAGLLSPAAADTAIVVSGTTKSSAYSNCVAQQRAYNSSWTKITVSCYYSGYASSKYWYAFHYRSVAG